MKTKINEIIVVEGKNDSNRLKSFFECDTIETHGSAISKNTIELIRKAKQTRGVILFLDPDSPGEKIRCTINSAIKGCKNAFIQKNLAKTTKKVGIEHASKEDIFDALQHCMSYDDQLSDTLTWEEYCELGLMGESQSQSQRDQICKIYHIGKCNAKTLYKRLNMLQLTKHEIEKVMRSL